MEMMTMTPRQRARYEAAERQGWLCYLCGVEMVDRRKCPELCHWTIYIDPHRQITIRMPRRGNPHAATLTLDGSIHAAHESCACAFMAYTKRHGQTVESAIARLRTNAAIAQSVSCAPDPVEPVDNPPKAQPQSATAGPSKAQLPGCTTPELHHSVTTSRGLTPHQVVPTSRARDDDSSAPICPAPNTPPGRNSAASRPGTSSTGSSTSSQLATPSRSATPAP